LAETNAAKPFDIDALATEMAQIGFRQEKTR
jgi:hypothetical protein